MPFVSSRVFKPLDPFFRVAEVVIVFVALGVTVMFLGLGLERSKQESYQKKH